MIDSDHIYVILSGFALVFTYTESGEPVVFGVFGRGNTIGECEAFLTIRRAYFVRVMPGSMLCKLPMSHMSHIAESNTEVVHMVANAACNSMNAFCRHAWVMNAQRLSDRLERLFYVFANIGLPQRGDWVELSVTHEDIALILNTDRPSVSRVLSKMALSGSVILGHRNIELDSKVFQIQPNDTSTPYPTWKDYVREQSHSLNTSNEE